MTCHSGGTLEIYVEPYLPTPMLVLVGHGPVIDALETLGRAAGYSLVPLRDASAWARLETLDLGRRASVVVATHADSDEDALTRVLRSEAGYVSLVASRKRTTSILGRLSQRGVAADRLGRLKAPAGLDLGAVTPVEIAISILAEIVQHHRSDKTVEAEAPPTPPRPRRRSIRSAACRSRSRARAIAPTWPAAPPTSAACTARRRSTAIPVDTSPRDERPAGCDAGNTRRRHPAARSGRTRASAAPP